MDRVFPGARWQVRSPGDVGLDPSRLESVGAWARSFGEPFRVVVARHGYLAVEWSEGVEPARQLAQASAVKSAYSCLLGIAVSEGMVPRLDAPVVDYYPEMMDVAEGEGPKAGRWAFGKDRKITFRQLICNTSGYMKPGEQPGKRFHYQTFGMNIVSNSLATIYGLYDSGDPGRLPGCARLVEEKLRDPIGGSWGHDYTDFQYGPGEGRKRNVFGHSLQILATAHDSARLGHLWLSEGDWDGAQVVPADYLKQATVTNPDILANEPEEKWMYGHGFWVNDHGKAWPDAPRDSFAAWGGGARHIWVCPSLDMVVVHNPGFWTNDRVQENRLRWENEALARLLDAVVR